MDTEWKNPPAQVSSKVEGLQRLNDSSWTALWPAEAGGNCIPGRWAGAAWQRFCRAASSRPVCSHPQRHPVLSRPRLSLPKMPTWLVHEATFEAQLAENARAYYHSTTVQGARVAVQANAENWC